MILEVVIRSCCARFIPFLPSGVAPGVSVAGGKLVVITEESNVCWLESLKGGRFLFHFHPRGYVGQWTFDVFVLRTLLEQTVNRGLEIGIGSGRETPFGCFLSMAVRKLYVAKSRATA